MHKIRNFDRLTDHGDAESRRLVLTIAERTLERLDAYNRIKSIMRFDGRTLTVGTRQWDLDAKRNVYLVGAGKACNAMARAGPNGLELVMRMADAGIVPVPRAVLAALAPDA